MLVRLLIFSKALEPHSTITTCHSSHGTGIPTRNPDRAHVKGSTLIENPHSRNHVHKSDSDVGDTDVTGSTLIGNAQQQESSQRNKHRHRNTLIGQNMVLDEEVDGGRIEKPSAR